MYVDRFYGWEYIYLLMHLNNPLILDNRLKGLNKRYTAAMLVGLVAALTNYYYICEVHYSLIVVVKYTGRKKTKKARRETRNDVNEASCTREENVLLDSQ